MQGIPVRQWKRNRMTIVVGMICSDGILLAADQRKTILAANEKEFDDYWDICKLVHLEKHKVLYAGVGDQVSRLVGDKLSSYLDAGTFDFDHCGIFLEGIACQTVREELTKPNSLLRCRPDDNRSLQVVFYGQEPQLWLVSISPPDPFAERIMGIKISGAVGNRARFFDYYFKPHSSVFDLIFMASHIVLSAHCFDPPMIRGLDVALFQNGSCRVLEEGEKESLRVRSKALRELIRTQLFAK